MTAEQVIRAVFCRYEMKMVHNQYATVGATLRSCLSYLRGEKLLDVFFDDNYQWWRRSA